MADKWHGYPWNDPDDPTRVCERLIAVDPPRAVPTPVPQPATTPRAPNAVRIVCISDTHSLTDTLSVPAGDLLIVRRLHRRSSLRPTASTLFHRTLFNSTSTYIPPLSSFSSSSSSSSSS
jgi:hypothetical protein